jgi:hypothetical protein
MRMKRKIIYPLFLVFFLNSCVKDETLPDEPLATTGNFSWTTGGVTTVADSAVCYLQITTIYAYKSGMLNTVELNLSDVVQGTYPVNATSGNEIKLVKNGQNLATNNGTVTISSNTGSRLAGNFSAVLSGTAGTLSGQFTEIPFR